VSGGGFGRDESDVDVNSAGGLRLESAMVETGGTIVSLVVLGADDKLSIAKSSSFELIGEIPASSMGCLFLDERVSDGCCYSSYIVFYSNTFRRH
jgi:hypothetical protein